MADAEVQGVAPVAGAVEPPAVAVAPVVPVAAGGGEAVPNQQPAEAVEEDSSAEPEFFSADELDVIPPELRRFCYFDGSGPTRENGQTGTSRIFAAALLKNNTHFAGKVVDWCSQKKADRNEFGRLFTESFQQAWGPCIAAIKNCQAYLQPKWCPSHNHSSKKCILPTWI